MLKEIRFKNWKSFKDATLYIDSLTVLIGANASGKSNVLDGLDFLNKAVKGNDLESIFRDIRGGTEWAALKPGHQFTIEVLYQVIENYDYLYSITVSTEPYAQILAESLIQITNGADSKEGQSQTIVFQTEPVSSGSNGIAVHIFPTSESIMQTIRRDVSVMSQVRNIMMHSPLKTTTSVGKHLQTISIIFIVAVLERIFIIDPIPSLMRNYSALSGSLLRDASNLAGILASMPVKEKESIEKTLSDYVAQLPEREIRKVWAEPVGRFSTLR